MNCYTRESRTTSPTRLSNAIAPRVATVLLIATTMSLRPPTIKRNTMINHPDIPRYRLNLGSIMTGRRTNKDKHPHRLLNNSSRRPRLSLPYRHQPLTMPNMVKTRRPHLHHLLLRPRTRHLVFYVDLRTSLLQISDDYLAFIPIAT